MLLYFHVTDRCNRRCPKCHWFSEPIIHPQDLPPEAPSRLVRRALRQKIDVDGVVFSGGEPGLWMGLASSVNQVPDDIPVRVFTNGTVPQALDAIRRQITLRISIHSGVNWSTISDCAKMAIERQWRLKYVAYEGDYAGIGFPGWFDPAAVQLKPEQMEEGKKWLSSLVGTAVMCRPKVVLIAADGHAYCCEKGLRTKDPAFRCSFSAWAGTPIRAWRQCRVDRSCLGNIINEQDYHAIFQQNDGVDRQQRD